jgi:sporulation protein YlmC with PRC-barrel domain
VSKTQDASMSVYFLQQYSLHPLYLALAYNEVAMLQLSSNITEVPVMSLRTGGKIATAEAPIINPNNLKIEGWYCQDHFSKQPLVLLAQDVRDFVPQGLAVNDHEVLSDPHELVRLKDILELEFTLLGKPVVTNHRRRLGKVSDYAIDTKTMLIQKLYVTRPVYKSLTSGQLSIDRTQIVEITNRRVIVKDVDVKVGSAAIAPAVS